MDCRRIGADFSFDVNILEKLRNLRQEDPCVYSFLRTFGKIQPKTQENLMEFGTHPQPVVIIVRAVDDLLKSEFGLSQGLADTSKSKAK